MNCREAQTLIHKELDRELSEEERGALDAHLGQCPRCAALREGMLRLAIVARDLPTERAPTVDLAGAVTATLRRRRRFRLALGAGLAAAAVLLLCLTLWPRTEPTGAPRGPAVRRPLTQRTPLPARQAPERVAALSPDNVLAWLENAWQRTASEVSTVLPSVKASLLPGDLGSQRGLQSIGSIGVELQETKRTLLELAREVGEQVFPFELPRREPRHQNG